MTGAGVDVYGYPLAAENAAVWQQAAACARRGELTAAVDTLHRILVAQPEFVPALVQLSHWLLALDRYREARALARRAAAAAPRSFELTLEIVRLLRRFEEPERIERLVQGLDWSGCGSAILLARMVAELGPVGLYGQARTLLALAERIDPSLPQTAHARATIQMLSGELPAARETLRRLADARAPQEAQMRWLLSLKPPGTEQSQRDASVLAERLERTVPGREDEAYLAFALHNVLHALGRDEESWAALERGCRAKRALVPYRKERQLALFETLEQLPRLHEVPSGGEATTNVIFVVGMHRSGTTLLERLLGGHGDVTDGGESYAFSAALRHATDHYAPTVLDLEGAARLPGVDLAALGAEFLEYARWKAAGRPWLTEKLPSNFLNLGSILAAVPSARILHMRRDPLDTCFSNLRTYFSNAAAYSYDQRDLAEYYLRYRALMAHWHALWPGRILDVDYEALVEDPERQARRVMEFCGLDFQPAVLDIGREAGMVATASVADIREGIRKDRGGVWRRYAAHLGPLVEGLAAAYPDAVAPH